MKSSSPPSDMALPQDSSFRSSAPGKACVSRSIDDVGAEGASISSLTSMTSSGADTRRGCGRRLARIDHQTKRDRSTEVCSERGLHLFAPFLALLLVRRGGEREHRGVVLGRHEAARCVQRLGHPLELRQDVVGPGEGELVARRHRARRLRWGRRRLRERRRFLGRRGAARDHRRPRPCGCGCRARREPRSTTPAAMQERRARPSAGRPIVRAARCARGARRGCRRRRGSRSAPRRHRAAPAGRWRGASRRARRRAARARAPSPRDRAVRLGRPRARDASEQLDHIGRHRDEERVAQPCDQPLGQPADFGARADGIGDGREGARRVAVGQRVDEILDGRSVVGNRSGGDHLVERGQRVARRPSSDAEHVLERAGRQFETGVLDDVLDVLGEDVDRQEVELEVLRAAADRLLTFCGSVVARTKTTCAGGSSSVLRSAFDAPFESMWTSSRMYTLRRPAVPSAARSFSSRMLSTPLFDAASSSNTSNDVPRSIARHTSHTPQGSPSLTFGQFRAFARMRAVDVLPVPRGPLNRYAWETRSSRTALRRARTTCSWPSTSSKRWDR